MISIIIPVYHVDKYVSRCLDSILNQTFLDWECILIDDGSQDESGIICDEYAAKEKRFQVIHQENKGVSVARNKGLDSIEKVEQSRMTFNKKEKKELFDYNWLDDEE